MTESVLHAGSPRSAEPDAGRDVVLDVRDLVVRRGDLVAVRGVNLRVRAGQRVGVVGESGAGKSPHRLAVWACCPSPVGAPRGRCGMTAST